MASRAEVYAAIDSERDYQERRWGDAGCNHEIAAWITYMRSYLDEAANLASRNSPETIALDCIRKVTAMGVRCMEEHGAPKRTAG
jgi:hypothetical protein